MGSQFAATTNIKWPIRSFLLAFVGWSLCVNDALAGQSHVPPDKAELTIASAGTAGHITGYTLITIHRDAGEVKIQTAQLTHPAGYVPQVSYNEAILPSDQYEKWALPLAGMKLEKLQGAKFNNLIQKLIAERYGLVLRMCGAYTSHRLRLTWDEKTLNKTISFELGEMNELEDRLLAGRSAAKLQKFAKWMIEVGTRLPAQQEPAKGAGLHEVDAEAIFKPTDEALWSSHESQKLNDALQCLKNPPLCDKSKTEVVSEEEPVHRVMPIYPFIARSGGVGGSVQIGVIVDEVGNVISVYVISGHPLLRQAVFEAVHQWKFRSASTKREFTITFNFQP